MNRLLPLAMFALGAGLAGAWQDADAEKKMLELSAESDQLFKQEKWDQCAARRREALELAKKLGDKWYQAALTNNLGFALSKAGKFDETEEAYRQGLALAATEHSNPVNRGGYLPLIQRTAANVITLGTSIAVKSGYDKAAEFYGRLLKNLGTVLPYWTRRDLMIRHAEALRDAKQPDPAVAVYDQIGKNDTDQKYAYGAAQMAFGKAEVYLIAREWDKAAATLDDALKSAKTLGDPELEAWSHERLAEVHYSKDSVAEADTHLRHATQGFKKLNLKAGLVRAYEVWIKLQEKRGDSDAAKKYGDLLTGARSMSDPSREAVTIDDAEIKKLLPFISETNRILEIEHSGDKITFKNVLKEDSPVLWQGKLEYVPQPVYYNNYQFTVLGAKVTLNNRTVFVQKGRPVYVYKNGEFSFLKE